MQENLKKGYESFSKGTSLHGFAELYQTKSKFWTVLWAIIIATALTMTTYQMYQSVVQYVDQRPSVTISSPDEQDMFYPPLRICYMPWLFWVDWTKATKRLNLTKEDILIGISYIHRVNSETWFNVYEAQKHFDQTMADMNITTATELYKLVKRPLPIQGEYNITSYFDEIEFVFEYPNYFLFCYTISQRNMNEYFLTNRNNFETKSTDKILSFSLQDESYSAVQHFISPREYNQYMFRWIQRKSMYNLGENYTSEDLTLFAPPMLLFVDGYSDNSLEILTDNDAYNILVLPSARTTKNSKKNSCVEGEQTTENNNTCKLSCRALCWKNCSCRSINFASLVREDYFDRLCQKEIIFLNPDGSEPMFTSNTSKYYSNQTCPDECNIHLGRKKCEQVCIQPCTLWAYEINLSITTMASLVRKIGWKNRTDIIIEYPYGDTVFITTEVDLQTWENFVGSVGGLLGIWTGASIVSVLQFFYLCCFTNCGFRKDCWSPLCRSEKKSLHGKIIVLSQA